MSDLRKPIVRLHESFKKFVEKFNVLSNNVGDPLFLKTHNDSDVVTTINEINATFQAYDGKIIYPNDSVPTGAAFTGYDQNGQITDYPSYTGAQLPSTHLVISTNQHGGQDIDIDAGRDFLVNTQDDILLTALADVGITSQTGNIDITATLGDITLDAGGKDIDFTDGTDTRFAWNVGADNTLDVTGNLKETTSGNYEYEISGTSHDSVGGVKTITTNSMYIVNTGGTFQQNTTGDTIFNTSGDIVLDAGDSDIIFKRDGVEYVKTRMGVSGGVTYTKQEYTQGSMEIEAANNIILDAAGDIILDADGNEFVFRNGGGNDSARMTFADDGNFTLNSPNSLTLDIAGDIILDAAGDNITLKDGGTTRQEYTLGATTTIATTGNRSETVTGIVSDSAGGNYHIGATGNMDIDTRGTYSVVSGSTHTITAQTGDVDLNADNHIILDAGGDIYLDAGDSDIIFQRSGHIVGKAKLGIEGQSSTFGLFSTGGNFLVDAYGDIVLDAGDSDIIFKRNGTTFARHRLGVNGDPTQTRVEYTQGPLFLDVSGDIIMEADGGDVYLKDDGTEFLRFTHAGNGNAGINNNNIRVITFEDSDAVFENDVNIEGDLDVDGTLNVDGNTTLNGHVDLGSNGDDNISVLGKFDTNLRPDATNSYTLGTSTLKWRHAYLHQTLFAGNAQITDSADIANFNIKDNTISGSSGINLDAAGDITLHAGGDDITFEGSFNNIDSDRLVFDLGNNNTSLTQEVVNRHHILKADKHFYIQPKEGRVYLRDSASNNRFQVHFTTGTGTEVDVSNGSLTFDIDGDIVLDADGGDVLLKDNGTQFGRFENTSGNLKLRSGDTTAMTFDGANVTMAGQITLPSADLNTTEKTVHGAINEVHDDVGTLTDLSDSDYLNHKQSIIAALNRVGARVINVYDASGNLLNT